MTAPAAASGRIFISYRREETAYPAGWLFDSLAEHFGPRQIFKDVDSIEPGDDFVEVITTAVGGCDALLALIGDRWASIADEDGTRRLDNPEDFVRIEIEAALARKVRVIPILIAGARMPRADELPPSLVGLVRRHALELSPSRFNFDFNRLLKVLKKTLEDRAEAASRTEAMKAAEKRVAATPTAPATPVPTPDPATSRLAEPEADPLPAQSSAAPSTGVPAGHRAPTPEPRTSAAGVAPFVASVAPRRKRGKQAIVPMTPAQWAPDPFARHELRWWDGAGWTDHVCNAGKVAHDPVS